MISKREDFCQAWRSRGLDVSCVIFQETFPGAWRGLNTWNDSDLAVFTHRLHFETMLSFTLNAVWQAAFLQQMCQLMFLLPKYACWGFPGADTRCTSTICLVQFWPGNFLSPMFLFLFLVKTIQQRLTVMKILFSFPLFIVKWQTKTGSF